MKSLLLFAFITLTSCASMAPGKAYKESREYLDRPKVTESFFKSHQKNYSPEEIKALLSQKLILPGSLKIAVVKLGHDSQTTTLMNFHEQKQQKTVIQDQLVNAFNIIKGSDKRIKEVAFVPEMLMPDSPDLTNLRDVAAIMQADLVLIIESRSHTDTKFHLHKKNEAKAVTTVDAIAVDVKTGVIPFTSIATNSAHIREEKDFSERDLYLRATIEAENRALTEIVTNLGNYFN